MNAFSPPAKTNFDWVAPVYDALSFLVFGRKLRRAQTSFLDRLPPGASVLLVAGGTGWLLEQVLQSQPGRVLYLETSAQMLRLASRRILSKALPGKIEFRLGDQTSLRPEESFEVLMTPFVLDLFTEPTLRGQVLPRLRAALKPGGQWFVTDFVPTNRWWQQTLLWAMIRFFRLTAGIETRQLANWQRLLTEAGLTLKARRPQVGGMVSTEVWMAIDTDKG